MKTYHIREALPGDRDAIREVTLSAFQEYAAVMPSHWEAYRQSSLETLAEVQPAEQLVAEKEGVIVGTVLLFPAGTAISAPGEVPILREGPEIRLLGVSPEFRGLGIGAGLMEECLHRARRSGAAFITLHTTDLMQTAKRMYERMGFGRAPELDFQVSEDLTVQGYRLTLSGRKGSGS